MSGLIDALSAPRLNGDTSMVYDPVMAKNEELLDAGAVTEDINAPPRTSERRRKQKRRRAREEAMKTYPPEERVGGGDEARETLREEADREEEAEDQMRTLRQKAGIIVCYILVSVVWVTLVHLLGLAPWTEKARLEHINKPLSWVVFFLPLFVFGLGALSVWTSDSVCSVQNAVRGGNILYLGILVAIPLFTLLDANYQGDRTHFAVVVLTSITCAVLGQLDVWGTADWTCYVHHIESSLKTISIGLLLYALVMFAFNGKYFSKAS